MAEPPKDRRYTSSHEWALQEDGLIVVGITDYAVQELSDLVFIDLPVTGTNVTAGEHFGEIESVKAVSELSAPVSGSIVDVHSDLEDNLEPLVESPYEHGWIVKIDPSDPSEHRGLLSHVEYRKLIDEA